MAFKVSSIEWVAKFDWSQLKTGLVSAKTELGKVRDYTKTVTIEGKRLSGVMNSLGKSFIAAGAIAGGIFAGILQAAPSLIPALTRIRFQIDRIFKTLAPYFEPMLNWLGDVIGKFADWIEQNPIVAEGLAKITAAAIVLGAAGAAGIALTSFVGGLINAGTAAAGLLSKLISIKGIGTIGITIAVAFVAAELLKRFLDWYEGKLEPGITQAIPGYGETLGAGGRERRGREISEIIADPFGKAKEIATAPGGSAGYLTEFATGTNLVEVTINVAGDVISEGGLVEVITKSIMNELNLTRG